ncbi:MAG: hypothetical protein U0174_05665 [Polyangiaceae bacterium]
MSPTRFGSGAGSAYASIRDWAMGRFGDTIYRGIRRRATALQNDYGTSTEDTVLALSVTLECFPALARTMTAAAARVLLQEADFFSKRTHETFRERLRADVASAKSFESALRMFAQRERLRIAVRECATRALFTETAREISDLADVCIEAAYTHAVSELSARHGTPRDEDGKEISLAILGMGKLGGSELNPGSDVDLVLFYETDGGACDKSGAAPGEYFARACQRLCTLLESPTEDGIVWPVDLRLRPEGKRGPLAVSAARAEQYYEAWGRTWERAALLRARPVAGDLELGARILGALSPFVWRRTVAPSLADELRALVERGRAELSEDPARDVKHGPGGIREAEFFVQSLQLIWGGLHKDLREVPTLAALDALLKKDLVSTEEFDTIRQGYLLQRRAEHFVQYAAGIPTHVLPKELGLLSRALGFRGSRDFLATLKSRRARVHAAFRSLGTQEPERSKTAVSSEARIAYAVSSGSESLVEHELRATGVGTADLGQHLLSLARRPDWPLGSDRSAAQRESLVRKIFRLPEPANVARLLEQFSARLVSPAPYLRAFDQNGDIEDRFLSLCGYAPSLAARLVGHPELVDRVLFSPEVPAPKDVVDEELARNAKDETDDELFVAACRVARGVVMIATGLADVSRVLSDEQVYAQLGNLAEQIVLRTFERIWPRGEGLAVIAMGKLGDGELGYGSDLDLFFVCEDDDVLERAARAVQKLLRLLSIPHGEGPGYDLDTRLRPSGNQGLLVVTREAFERYHGVNGPPLAADWERMAMLRARVLAGDARMKEHVERVLTHARTFTAPTAQYVYDLRMRMERERSTEDRKRELFDPKLGYGGYVDLEFMAQWRVLRGEAPSAGGTPGGLRGLPNDSVLEEDYRFLRMLERRLHLLDRKLYSVHDPRSAHLALGYPSAAELQEVYEGRTNRVRAAFEALLGCEA